MSEQCLKNKIISIFTVICPSASVIDCQVVARCHWLRHSIPKLIPTTDRSKRSIWLTCGNPIEARNRSPRLRQILRFRRTSGNDPATTTIGAIPGRRSRPAIRLKFTTNDLTEWTDEGGSRTSDVDVPRRRLIYSTRANLTSRARFLSARRPNTCKAHTCRRWA